MTALATALENTKCAQHNVVDQPPVDLAGTKILRFRGERSWARAGSVYAARSAMQIHQIMSQPAICCRVSDNLNTAAQLMWDHDIGAVLVLDDGDEVAGIITDRDICMAAYTQGKSLASIPVSRSMATVVYSCRASDTLDHAEALMRDKQVHRVPVMDSDNRVAGVVSLNDIARHVHASKQDGVMSRGVVDTLSAICAPRGHMLAARPPTAMQRT